MFNAMSLNDPSQDGYVMDMWVTSHLHSKVDILCYIHNKRYNLPLAFVGNDFEIYVSNSGHSFLQNINPYHPLIL